MKQIITTILAATFMTTVAMAHSGGTNANGCHAGSKPYHCHNSKPKDYSRTTYTYVTPTGKKWAGYAYSTCKSYVRKYGGYCEKE